MGQALRFARSASNVSKAKHELKETVFLSLPMHIIEVVMFCLAFMALMLYLLNQVRRPTKWFGRPFLWGMNMSHSALTDWGLRHIQIGEDFAILEVGCGGGRTVQKLAALAAKGTVSGVDYADGSVAASREKNAQLIQSGRVEIKQASVSQLPFPGGKFDLVTAVETQYYWPDLIHDMQEILRVLKPGGTLIVIAESYKEGANNALQRPVMKLLKSSNLSAEDQRELFTKAGYVDVQIFEERTKGWICAVGKKPAG
jgi:SAM-dependent methyltransferase